MLVTTTTSITRLLEAYAGGDHAAFDRVFPLIYDDLRRIADGRLRRERDDHTLNATALVHEAYLKLARLDRLAWQNRAHFLAIASQAMRQILVDYAIRRGAEKRGGNRQAIPLDDNLAGEEQTAESILALHEALERLSQLDARQARIVECRFFGGMNLDETAAALDISAATVSRDWTMARAWLNSQLSEPTP